MQIKEVLKKIEVSVVKELGENRGRGYVLIILSESREPVVVLRRRRVGWVVDSLDF